MGRIRGAEWGGVASPCHLEFVCVGSGCGDPGESDQFGIGSPKGGAKLVGLSVPEVRKLLLPVVGAIIPDTEKVLAGSVWRRRHQHRARRCHYRKRKAEPPDR